MWLVLAEAPPLAPASGSVSIFTSEPRSSTALHCGFWVSGVGGTETREWPGNSVGSTPFSLYLSDPGCETHCFNCTYPFSQSMYCFSSIHRNVKKRRKLRERGKEGRGERERERPLWRGLIYSRNRAAILLSEALPSAFDPQ